MHRVHPAMYWPVEQAENALHSWQACDVLLKNVPLRQVQLEATELPGADHGLLAGHAVGSVRACGQKNPEGHACHTSKFLRIIC